MGWVSYTKQLLKLILEASKKRYVSSYNIADAYKIAGEKEKALEWYYKAYEGRSIDMSVVVSPFYDDIRSDPRFIEILRRMNLPQ